MRSGAYQVKRAYAVLGLVSGTPPGHVRRQYRALVRTWHPDRYTNDPAGQAEAARRMREINAAYRVVTQYLAAGNVPMNGGPTAASSPPPRGRLSREEIESLVQAIGSEGPLDTLLKAMGWVGGSIEGLLVPLLVAASVVRVAMLAFGRGIDGLLTDLLSGSGSDNPPPNVHR